MCGIIGICSKSKLDPNDIQIINKISLNLKHRGPDSTGYAMYGTPKKKGFVMRFKISENEAEK